MRCSTLGMEEHAQCFERYSNAVIDEMWLSVVAHSGVMCLSVRGAGHHFLLVRVFMNAVRTAFFLNLYN